MTPDASPTRRLILATAGMLLLSRAAWAQQLGRIYRVGVLETVPAVANAHNFGPFRQALHELGYVEGQNLAIEYRSADGQNDGFPALANELPSV
jgi:putative tryptophan/tyrosine transport system substrate-binding protein